jgi:hypothetical protein
LKRFNDILYVRLSIFHFDHLQNSGVLVNVKSCDRQPKNL